MCSNCVEPANEPALKEAYQKGREDIKKELLEKLPKEKEIPNHPCSGGYCENFALSEKHNEMLTEFKSLLK